VSASADVPVGPAEIRLSVAPGDGAAFERILVSVGLEIRPAGAPTPSFLPAPGPAGLFLALAFAASAAALRHRRP
jgi:hypothetical protein